VEFDLPGLEVVPEVAAYKYVKSKDEIVTTARAAAQRRALMSDDPGLEAPCQQRK
jgi:hypothetical protein